MATTAPTNTVKSVDLTHDMPSVLNKLMTIENEDLPALEITNKGSTKAVNELHEFFTDNLRPAAANAQLEGADHEASSYSAPTKLQNRNQIFSEEVTISGTTDAIKRYGSSGTETARLTLKKMRELKRDLDFTLLNSQIPRAEAGSDARQMRTAPEWYSTNVDLGAGGSNGSASAARTAGTTRPLTETMFQTQLQNCYEAAGYKKRTVLASPAQRKVISGFTGNATPMYQADGKKVVATVKFYESDFGTVEIRTAPNAASTDVHIWQEDLWKLAWLRNWTTKDIGPSGDSTKKLLVGEVTLECREEKASAYLTDLS